MGWLWVVLSIIVGVNVAVVISFFVDHNRRRRLTLQAVLLRRMQEGVWRLENRLAAAATRLVDAFRRRCQGATPEFEEPAKAAYESRRNKFYGEAATKCESRKSICGFSGEVEK